MNAEQDKEPDVAVDPLQFYLKKRVIRGEEVPVGKYMAGVVAIAVFVIAVVAGGGTVYQMHQNAVEFAIENNQAAPTSLFFDPTENLPEFKDKLQKNRLTLAVVRSITDHEMIVQGDRTTTRIEFDANVKVFRKGASIPLQKYQHLIELFLKNTQFAKPGRLFIPPEPFKRDPAAIGDITPRTVVNVIPTKDSPDGDVAKASSILIVQQD